MFFTIFFLLVAFILGLTPIYLCNLKLDSLARLSFSLIIGIVFLTFSIFLLSFPFGFSQTSIFLPQIIALILSIVLSQKFNLIGKINKLVSGEMKKEGLITIFFLAFWGVLFAKIWSQMLVIESDGLYAGWRSIWGDWAAHLTYINSFVYGNNFPPQNPILAGTKLSYPFLADFLSAILIKEGLHFIPAMILPSFILSLASVALLFSLAKALLKKTIPAILTVFIILLNGGLGFVQFFQDISSSGFWQTLSNLPREYTYLPKQGIQWINIVTSEFIPQRGFLLGLPIGLIVIFLLWETTKKRRKQLLLLAGFLTSTLPLIHAHSFLVVIFTATWIALSTIRRLKDLPEWAPFFLPILFFTLPQILYFYPHLGSQPPLKLQIGWMAYKTHDNLIWFWIKNFGLMVILIPIGFFLAPRKIKLFYLPFVTLFILANFFLFQPWEWDNTKIFTYWYIFSSPLAVITLSQIWKRKQIFNKISVLVLILLMALSGALDILKLTDYQLNKLRFFDNQQLELAELVRQTTPKNAIFLTAPTHDHLIPVLTGRKILLGFRGWLWTYGIDYSDREADVFKMLRGEEGTKDLLRKYKVDYVVIGPPEKTAEINASEDFYRKSFPLFLEKYGYAIFNLKEAY